MDPLCGPSSEDSPASNEASTCVPRDGLYMSLPRKHHKQFQAIISRIRSAFNLRKLRRHFARQFAAAEKLHANRAFEQVLIEHVKAYDTDTRIEGHGQACSYCGEPIYGIVGHNIEWGAVHFGCPRNVSNGQAADPPCFRRAQSRRRVARGRSLFSARRGSPSYDCQVTSSRRGGQLYSAIDPRRQSPKATHASGWVRKTFLESNAVHELCRAGCCGARNVEDASAWYKSDIAGGLRGRKDKDYQEGFVQRASATAGLRGGGGEADSRKLPRAEIVNEKGRGQAVPDAERDSPTSLAVGDAYSALAPGPYRVKYADIQSGRSILQKTKTRMTRDADDVLHARAECYVGRDFISARTVGDGACALHAVFGSPDAKGELFRPNARVLAVALLGPSLEKLQVSHPGSMVLGAITASFWDEFVAPVLEGEGTDEGHLFMHCLQEVAPSVRIEVEQHWSRRRNEDHTSMLAKRRLLVASSLFFASADEETVIRQAGMLLGLIPSCADFRSLSRDELDVTIVEHGNCSCEFLGPAFQENSQGNRSVRGTQILFPEDGPKSKYDALFDTRDCSDVLRYSFLV